VRKLPAERAIAAARAELARDAGRLDWAGLQHYARAADGDATFPLFVRPYRGLAPFRREHAWAFHGRADEVAEAAARVLGAIERGAPRFVVVAGAAGVGKTSLLLAGLAPALAAEREDAWSTAVVAPGATPIADLAGALAGVVDAEVAADAEAVLAAVRAWHRDHPARGLLVVVDPLEELFTAGLAAPERDAFARLLWSLACDPALRVVVVAALRIDFVGRCGEVVLDERRDLRLDQVVYDADHRVLLAQLGAPQLRAAILGPARAVGVEVDPGLAERLVADVAGQPGALSLLQHALHQLWARREGRRLGLAAYDALGGVAGALERHAEQVLAGLGPAQLRQARRLLVRLASVRDDPAGESHRRVLLAQLGPGPGEDEAFAEALARLGAARLVVLGERTGPRGKQATAELVHDALLHRWQRLREWVREDRARVVELAKLEAWVSEWQEHGALLDDLRLGYALEVAGRGADDLPAGARELIAGSRARAEAERRAEADRRGELEGMLEATRDLLRAADDDMRRAETELLRARRRLRVAAAIAAAAGLAALGPTCGRGPDPRAEAAAPAGSDERRGR
jgi:hypothetical protein